MVPRPGPGPVAKRPVFGAALAVGVVLSVFSAGYGYERDELYFRMLRPAWGYVDQPPLAPLVARAMRNLLTDSTWAVRIPATLAAMTAVIVVALLTRELGGGRGAQTLAAWAFGCSAFPVILGHALLTATLDMPVWPAVVLFAVRAVKRAEPRWWLAAGAVVGISLYNKLLVAVLLVALAVGLTAVGPRRLLWSRWVLAGLGLAIVVGAPNLIYQATHGWPQFAMGGALADDNGSSVRVLMWPFLFILLGPPLVPIWIAGLVALWRDRAVRFIAAAFPVLLVLVFAMGAQFYYPFGLLTVLFAAGCPPAWRWASERQRQRRTIVIAVAANSAVSLVIGLPLIPISALHHTPVAAMNQVVQDSVGWPRYVAEIARVYRGVPVAERAHTIVYASNYGEAGAVARYGPAAGLPAVYSGHNALTDAGHPPSTTTTVVFVGGQYPDAHRWYGSCVVKAHLDDDLDVDNEEQDEPIAICRDPLAPWPTLWPRMRHLD